MEYVIYQIIYHYLRWKKRLFCPLSLLFFTWNYDIKFIYLVPSYLLNMKNVIDLSVPSFSCTMLTGFDFSYERPHQALSWSLRNRCACSTACQSLIRSSFGCLYEILTGDLMSLKSGKSFPPSWRQLFVNKMNHERKVIPHLLECRITT